VEWAGKAETLQSEFIRKSLPLTLHRTCITERGCRFCAVLNRGILCRPGLRSADSTSNTVFNRSSVNLPPLRWSCCLELSTSQHQARDYWHLNSFSSLIYFTYIAFDILLAPTICKPRSTSPNLYLYSTLHHELSAIRLHGKSSLQRAVETTNAW